MMIEYHHNMNDLNKIWRGPDFYMAESWKTGVWIFKTSLEVVLPTNRLTISDLQGKTNDSAFK